MYNARLFLDYAIQANRQGNDSGLSIQIPPLVKICRSPFTF